MHPSTPEGARGNSASLDGLPGGPLPVRRRSPAARLQSASPPLDELVDLSWFERGQDSPAASGVEDPDPAAGDDAARPAVGLSVTTPTPETDDDVHFGVAARALGVSRKTVERMVKRGQLDRGPSNAPATVSKRALVALLEQRRRDVSQLTRATEIEQARSESERLTADSGADPASALHELLVPVLAPLLDELVALRTRAAVLENQLEAIRARDEQQRARDELLFALATQGWRGRRKTRKAVLRHYVLGEDRPKSDSETE